MGSTLCLCSYCKKVGKDVEYKYCTGIKAIYMQNGKRLEEFSTYESGYFCDSCFTTVQDKYKKMVIEIAKRKNVESILQMGSKIKECSYCGENQNVVYRFETGINFEIIINGKVFSSLKIAESGYYCDFCFVKVRNKYKNPAQWIIK